MILFLIDAITRTNGDSPSRIFPPFIQQKPLFSMTLEKLPLTTAIILSDLSPPSAKDQRRRCNRRTLFDNSIHVGGWFAVVFAKVVDAGMFLFYHPSHVPLFAMSLRGDSWAMTAAIIEKCAGWLLVQRPSVSLSGLVSALWSWAGRSRVMREPDSLPWGAVNTS